MNARDIISVKTDHNNNHSYTQKTLANGDYFIRGSCYVGKCPIVCDSWEETGEDDRDIYCIQVIRKHQHSCVDVGELLRSIDWREYLSPTSGAQLHLRPKEVYQAVDDALMGVVA